MTGGVGFPGRAPAVSAVRRGGPGAVLGLGGDAVEDMAARGARDYAKVGVTLDLLGAERRLRVPFMGGAHFWLERHFLRVGDGR